VPEFTELKDVLSNSPDFNTVDYSVCCIATDDIATKFLRLTS